MNFKDRLKNLFQKRSFVLIVWIVLAIFSASKQYAKGSYNNYLIFKHVFYHTLTQENLYIEYPELYNDSNYYGPAFSAIIAPFAMLPDWLALSCWNISNALFLFFAIRSLPLSETKKIIVAWLVTNELFTSFVNFQFNASIAATLILAYSFIKKEKDFWAALVIIGGTFIKLYSVAGLAFLFFSKHKIRLIAAGIIWSVAFFVLPMLFTESDFIIQSYFDWFNSIVTKDNLNGSLETPQDISIMGIVRRLLNNREISSILFLIPGMLLFSAPFLNLKYYNDQSFQQLLLCSVMLFVVLFSSSSESSTYIVAFTGVAIWFVLHDRPYPRTVLLLMIFAFVLTSLSPIIFPLIWRNFVIKYSLKALPCVLIWFYTSYELIAFRYQNGIRKND